ncbi:MAG: hypothetical protein ABI113_03255 [Mucilaginibacter sp.]
MGLIKEPIHVDFSTKSEPWTKEELLDFSKIMNENKQNNVQHNQVLVLIENIITKATVAGGFNHLSETEKEELNKLSLFSEKYEDEVLKIMPLSYK